MFDVIDVLDSTPLPMPIETPVVIYGAGNTGKCICRYLQTQDYVVSGYIDSAAQKGQYVDETPIWRVGEFPDEFLPAQHTVIIAVHNRDVCIAAIIEEVKQWQFKRILTMIDFTNLFPHDQPPRFWLAPSSVYRKHVEEIARLFSLLSDDKSREYVGKILAFRISGNYSVINAT